MKIHKMFCIDQDIAEKLKKENASALANHLLIEYFKEKDVESMTPEQKEKRIVELKIRLEAIEKLEAIGVKP